MIACKALRGDTSLDRFGWIPCIDDAEMPHYLEMTVLKRTALYL